MTSRRLAAWTLALVAGVAGVAALGWWRAETLRDGLRDRVGVRLAGTAALTRDAAALWVRERRLDAGRAGARTPALAPDAPARELTGAGAEYVAAWVVPTAAGAHDLVPEEVTAVARVAADGGVYLAGPFAAATPSGIAVSVVGPATSVPGSVSSAVVLRADPAQGVLPLVVRRAPPGTEVGRLLAQDGARVYAVSPASDPVPTSAGWPTAGAAGSYTFTAFAPGGLPPAARVAFADGPPGPSAPLVYRTPGGPPVLAAFAHVPGTAWMVERQVDVAEIDAHGWRMARDEALLGVAGLAAIALGALAANWKGHAGHLRDEIRLAIQREATAEALRASEASARGFVEHAPYGICRVSVDGRFTAVNPALVHMLGYRDADALLAADLGDLYVEPAARARLLRRHAEGEAMVQGIETTWRCADGSELPVHLDSREVRDAHGSIAYYEAYVQDLRALRSAEEALRQAEKLAAVGGFVSGVAHELNNPLSAVLLFADGLLDDPGRPSDDREALTLIREQALRARAIVRDLLAFVRGAGGATATVSTRTVLEAAARALAPQVAAAGGRLDVVLAPNLGWIRVDRAGVEQVVTNLVLNAAQAAPGRPVRLAAERTGGSLRITVEDEGPGLPPTVLARMFEPFFTTKPVGLGTGLGLSVSLGIVERHGGTLTAVNRPATEGTGARLTVMLPLAPRPAGAPEARTGERPVRHAPTPDADAPEPTPGYVPRVLVVDDEVPIRLALVRFFTRRGWAVDEAGDGRAAFARLLDAEAAGAPYDLVLSDVRMPDVSGIALHDWVARTRPAMLDRLVFATGDLASPESAEFARRTGCQVLEKPFDPAALDALARRAVGARAAADEPGAGAASSAA